MSSPNSHSRSLSFVISLFSVLSSLVLLPSRAFAQSAPWSADEFIRIFQDTVAKPDIYEVPDANIAEEENSSDYTNTPCAVDSDCASHGSNYVCLPNSDTPPKKFCALPSSKNVRINFKIESTDYTPDNDQSQKLPKLQNLSEHYLQNPTLSANTLNYGSLELLLPATYKLELKLAALERALETSLASDTVIGPMPNRELTLPNGTKTTYVDLYNELPSYLKTKPKGWQEQALKDSNPLVKAISFVNPSPYDVVEYAYAYNNISVTFFNSEIDLKTNVIPYEVHPRGDLFSAYEYAKITLPSSLVKPFKSDRTIVALTDSKTLVSSLPSTSDYTTYISDLVNKYPSSLDNSDKPEADAIQPAGPESWIDRILNILSFKTTTKNIPSPSQITTNELIALIGAHKITSQELSAKPIDKKAFPALTSKNFSLPMGQGGGVSTLTDTFSRLIPCEADVYSSEIAIKDYLLGKRQTCSGGNVNPPTPPTTCYVNSACNNNPTSEDLTGVKERVAEYANLLLGGLGTPLLDQVDTVINQSIAKGVSPIFSLAIWLHESGASNYDGICQYLGHSIPTSGYCQRILDFGINLDSIATTSNPSGGWNSKFSEQLASWLDTPSFYLTNYCAGEFAKPGACAWGIFGSAFSPGTCTNIGVGSQYVKDVMNIYHFLTSTQAEPCYPIALP